MNEVDSAAGVAPIPKNDSNKENSSKKKNGAKTGAAYQVPWVEKYRPKTLADVVGNSETVSRLQAIAQTGNLPNLILAGPPGTGKTTSVHALARQLLGSSYKDAVLELNASDARGIDVGLHSCSLFGQQGYQLTNLHDICLYRWCEIASRALP